VKDKNKVKFEAKIRKMDIKKITENQTTTRPKR
jgi:hypothetical protein